MFSELPKLFGRDFATAYFLPVAAFVAATLALLARYGFTANLLGIAQADILLGTTVVVLVSWLGGIGLLSANHEILRLMEGYGRFNPARLWGWIEKRKYQSLQKAIRETEDEYKIHRVKSEAIPKELRLMRMRLKRELVERFPDDEAWLLPTPFGNIVRAFEVYPRAMYGLDSIPGWTRLLAIVPRDYRELVDAAKATTDFWVNVILLSLVYVGMYLIVAVQAGRWLGLEFPIGALIVAALAFSRADNAAIGWGETVKAAFDVFLPELRTRLQMPPAATREQELELWTQFSQATIYRLPKSLPDRLPTRSSVEKSSDSAT